MVRRFSDLTIEDLPIRIEQAGDVTQCDIRQQRLLKRNGSQCQASKAY